MHKHQQKEGLYFQNLTSFLAFTDFCLMQLYPVISPLAVDELLVNTRGSDFKKVSSGPSV